MVRHAEFLQGLDALAERLALMGQLLQTQAGRSPDLERAWQRCVALMQDLTRWKDGVLGGDLDKARSLNADASTAAGANGAADAAPLSSDYVYWVETLGQGLHLH